MSFNQNRTLSPVHLTRIDPDGRDELRELVSSKKSNFQFILNLIDETIRELNLKGIDSSEVVLFLQRYNTFPVFLEGPNWFSDLLSPVPKEYSVAGSGWLNYPKLLQRFVEATQLKHVMVEPYIVWLLDQIHLVSCGKETETETEQLRKAIENWFFQITSLPEYSLAPKKSESSQNLVILD